MGANSFVIETVTSGYKIPFLHTPKRACFKNNKTALQNKLFVTESIAELLRGGKVRKTGFPTVVNPLSVSDKEEKKRLIQDLRYVNAYIWKERVKFEEWKTFKNYLHPGCFMFDFDFKSGYHHIEVFE